MAIDEEDISPPSAEMEAMFNAHLDRFRKLFTNDVVVTLIARKRGDIDSILLTDEESPADIEELIQTIRILSAH